MKKKIYAAAVMLFALAAPFVVTACDDDNEDEEGSSSSSSAGNAVDLGLSVYWADRNVGASSASAYGNYYAWGETKTKSSYTDSNNTTYGVSLDDWSGKSAYDAARANWGGTWRTPTESECDELIEDCSWTWTTKGGNTGYLVTGSNGNSIFLPAAGDMSGSELEDDVDSGCYWTSTPYGNALDHAYGMTFLSEESKFTTTDWNCRDLGFTIRPVKY